MLEVGSRKRSPYENLFMTFFFDFGRNATAVENAQKGGEKQISFNTISRQLLSH